MLNSAVIKEKKFKESPAQNTRHDLNDRICSPEYSIENSMKKIPTGSKVMTILANMQIS